MNKRFILTYTFLPILLGILYQILNKKINFSPDWFYYTEINIFEIIFIFLFLFFIQYFLILILKPKLLDNKISGKRLITKFIFFIISFTVGIFTGINFREFADNNNFNLIYSTSSIFLLILFFSEIKINKFSILFSIITGFLTGINGSKAALLNFIIFYFTFFKEINIKVILFLSISSLAIFFTIPHYIIRYADQGLSMITISGLCQDNRVNTFNLYLQTFTSKINGESFHPIIEFFNLVDFQPGRNITPTVAGDLYCFHNFLLIGFILYLIIILTLYILPAFLFRYRNLERAVLVFISLGIINSTLMDVFKFGIITNLAIILSRLIFKEVQKSEHLIGKS